MTELDDWLKTKRNPNSPRPRRAQQEEFIYERPVGGRALPLVIFAWLAIFIEMNTVPKEWLPATILVTLLIVYVLIALPLRRRT